MRTSVDILWMMALRRYASSIRTPQPNIAVSENVTFLYYLNAQISMLIVAETQRNLACLERHVKDAAHIGLSQLGALANPHSAECKKVVRSLHILLKRIRTQSHVQQHPFRAGSKAFVIGAPYRPFPGDPVRLYATEIFVDDGMNRNDEINFKQHLVHLYTHVYK